MRNSLTAKGFEVLSTAFEGKMVVWFHGWKFAPTAFKLWLLMHPRAFSFSQCSETFARVSLRRGVLLYQSTLNLYVVNISLTKMSCTEIKSVRTTTRNCRRYLQLWSPCFVHHFIKKYAHSDLYLGNFNCLLSLVQTEKCFRPPVKHFIQYSVFMLWANWDKTRTN